MRIHSDILSHANLYRAASVATRGGHGSVYVDVTLRGSRSRARAFDVKLEGDGTVSRYRVNAGTSRTVDRYDRPYAATWESWGWFLGALYRLDPAMRTPYYADAEDFHRVTEGKFRILPGDAEWHGLAA